MEIFHAVIVLSSSCPKMESKENSKAFAKLATFSAKSVAVSLKNVLLHPAIKKLPQLWTRQQLTTLKKDGASLKKIFQRFWLKKFLTLIKTQLHMAHSLMFTLADGKLLM